MECLIFRLKQVLNFYREKLVRQLLRDERGQTIIEYILILIVVLGVILGGLYQLNSAFRVWANSYFGDYLACLLETGELPSMGGPAGECNQFYKEFNLKDGRPLIASEGGGSSSNPQGSFTSSSKRSSPGNDSAYSGGGGGGGGSSYVQTLPAPRMASRSGAQRFRATASEADESGSSTGGAQVTELSGGSGGKIVRMPVRDTVGYRQSVGGDDDKDEKKERFKATGVLSSGGTEKTQNLIRIDRKVASTTQLEDEELSFGDFLRYIIIAAIIIALVLFIGGQALQVSKSME